MAYWLDSSLGFAKQSAFGTANSTDGDFAFLKCELPKVSFANEKEELDLLTGQVGAATERLVGRRSGTLSFAIPLEGLKAGYDATTDDPGDTGVLPGWFVLLANAMGSNMSAVSTAADFEAGLMASVSAYTAAGVASATSTAITFDDATASDKIAVGELVVTAASGTSTTPTIGWAKAKAGQVVQLFEASGNTNNPATTNVYGTATAYASSEVSATAPVTFRWAGDNTTFCYILSDCIADSIKINWESGVVPTAEFSFKFYEFGMDKTKGGLVVPDSFQRIPQLVGASNGRATIDGSMACGLESCTWEWTAELKEVKCHGGTQGITAVSIRTPRIKASFSVLHTSSDLVYDAAGSAGNVGQYVWQSKFERNVRVSMGVYVGSTVGRIWSLLLPSALLTETPAVEDRDGSVAYTLNLEAGSYTGDTTDTAETTANSPINSIARVGLA